MGWDWGWYPKPKPRKPANGIKAQSRKFGQTWWASKWLAALERLVDAGRLSRGRSYARSGQVLNIDITPGRIESRVQGSRARPYRVTIKIKPLSDKEWNRIANAMAEQAIFAAKLLSGEMPQNIEDAFASAKVNLFPISRHDLETECSCPDYSNPCKHIAAVYYLLGEQFDSDPFLLFRLRGKSKDAIMALLRARRAQPATAGEAKAAVPAAPAEPIEAEASVSLEAALDQFWTAGEPADFHVTIAAPPIEAAPIKRFGVPVFWRSKNDFMAMMSSAYQSVTQAALNAAFGDADETERSLTR